MRDQDQNGWQKHVKVERDTEMDVLDMLDELQRKVLHDAEMKDVFLATRKEKDVLSAFCKKCQEYGYDLYPMDIIQAGEEMYAEIKRSTNGGGENSPMLEGEDDLYEMFFAVIEK